jgi:hypothetical protein
MSVTLQQRPGSSTPPPDKPGRTKRDIWSRRLAIGLPVVVVLLLQPWDRNPTTDYVRVTTHLVSGREIA